MSQKEHSSANRTAWSDGAYEAWHNGYGTPEEAARAIAENPGGILREYSQYLGNLQGKAVANLLGSHGRRAVALAILGAEVTVVDISEEYQRYACEVAQSAGVSINYVVSDVLDWPTGPFTDAFDFVLMEYGILHYFVDLEPLTELIHTILKPGGKLVLHEFHPLTRKFAPSWENDRLVLEGDYFSEDIVEKPAPFRESIPDASSDALPQCRMRYWQMGELVSAVGAGGLIIETLVEKPHAEYPAVPGIFTLVARRGS